MNSLHNPLIMRTSHRYLSFLTLFLLFGFTGQAQDLPQPSPNSSVKQTIGITDIEITYSRPGVKGRTIWGDLVPYGDLWRAGANMATTINFEHDVTIDGNRVPAGKYSIFAIPGETEWTLIINSNWNQGGTGQYKEEEDILRLTANAQDAPFQERLAYSIEPISDDEASVVLHWAKKSVSFMIDVPTAELVMKGLKAEMEEIDNAWAMYAQSAQYALEGTGDEETAFEWIGRSLDLNTTYYNTMIKSQMFAHIGDYKAAIKTGNEAIKLGDASDSNAYKSFWKGQIEANLAEWATK